MICYLIIMLLCRAHLAIGIVDQFWWAANRTLAEQDLRRGVFYKHKCRVFLVCSYRAIKCYLVSMWLCITHLAIGSVDQLRWAANSTLAEQDLWRVCCINTKVGFIWYAPHRAIICYLSPEESVLYKHKSRIYDMLIQSYNMLSIKHVAVKYSPSYRLSRPALVSRKQDSGRAGPEKSVL